MKQGDLKKVERLLSAPVRLRIMALLIAAPRQDFPTLQKKLDITRGNLSSHGKQLDDAGYIRIHKSFKNNRPRTTYEITPRGRRAFSEYVSFLEKIITTPDSEE
ncbi:winged helix-turn-helix domain-containing protein [Chitinivibrio alkaliphilus]|uniref:Transcriptional regulator, MarR family n=1 Tax=Chitinivibrio alkaliphilus ACht1 TaxID=1313304 RepID=U7D8L3_9BACT|nr:transcriptional regulator [Chitinivibrio alkaliphilus]ERP38739.1 transcriptional regulator, MarR family [Chitinivibrio alkaliphilus ACht1]